ncbi:hypothetical protein [Nodularia spumigena]|uniref:L-Fucosyltransferase n=1 Tax=Nodularia spumigena UHCC 0060 TaxID=3110300 RepID=A0ABU5UXS8_NODSP|nr:hypothetical protein [Nodularia spumigena]MEA5526338.1 hypothetical protein [Nodularia spumigena UHCC 0143]MEA5611102.1 hypothetical protein [Nodularia spumigena UHCC 0060]MEA5612884.1 hypothetical protein [Nodularia spumigena UHCC 0040]
MMLIQAGKFGRLGNRLILTAHILALSKEINHKFIDFGFEEYCDYFKISQVQPFLAYPEFCNFPFSGGLRSNIFYLSRHLTVGDRLGKLSNRLHLKNLITSIYLSNIVDRIDVDVSSCPNSLFKKIQNAKLVVFDGWRIRSHTSLKKNANWVRHKLRPTNEIENIIINKKIFQPIENSSVLVGIHVRRDDYIKYAPHLVFADSFYEALMIRIEKFFFPKHVNFVICSTEK